MNNLLYAFLLISSSVVLGQQQNAPTPQIGIKVSLGETITTDQVVIEFKEVLEDSRCPSDVDCVWAGQAKVKVAVASVGITTKVVDYIISERKKNTLLTNDGYRYTIIALTPYPTTTNQGKRDYSIVVAKELID